MYIDGLVALQKEMSVEDRGEGAQKFLVGRI